MSTKYTRTALQATLATIAPLICIRTIWSRYPDCECEFRELSKPGNCFDGEKRKEWTPWQSEIEALAIVDFDIYKGSTYLVGTWEKKGDKPQESNPTISGYENQMTVEALESLKVKLDSQQVASLKIREAIAECERHSQESYDAQMAARQTA